VTFQTFIDDYLRVAGAINDLKTLAQDVFNGDGTLKAFQLANRPILENSYTVKISDVVQTETTHYTLNKDTGILTFVTAPDAGNDNVTIDYEHVKMRDAGYLEAINSAIRHFKIRFWTDEIDTSNAVMVVDQNDYDLATLFSTDEIVDVISVAYRESSDYFPPMKLSM